MLNRAFAKAISASFLLALLTACGGGGGQIGGSGSSSGGTGSSSGGSSGGSSSGGGTTPVYRMGFVDSAGTFQAGAVAIGQTPLAAGGSSSLRVDVVDTANSNALYTTPVTVTFNSSCVSQNLSKINISPVDTIGGSATATYVAQGCSGTDLVTATALVGTTNLSASGSIQVLPSSIGGLEYVSATPTTIGLRGSGQTETSTVVFRVRNASGGVVPNQDVSFTLNTTTGGITVSPATGKTDSNGLVQTVVRSGSVHTVVRVTASTVDSTNSATLSSQSEQLTISTGIPDQDSYSLSVLCNNVSGWDIDGTTVGVTLRGADRFNNPVPDGTAVTFTTEGGGIEGNCTTKGGACGVTWTSQNPRPVPYSNGATACSNPDRFQPQGSDAACALRFRAGRSAIVATSIGEESYLDADGDGLFDSSEAFVDLAEAFVDFNGNGVRDAAISEPFMDFNSNGSYDAPDTKFNGLLCDSGGNTLAPCALPRTTFVRGSNLIIMSSDTPSIHLHDDITIEPPAVYDSARGEITVAAGGIGTIYFVVRDLNDQPMPNGASISVTIANSGSVSGTAAYIVPCKTDDTAGGNYYGFSFKANDPPSPAKDVSGTFELKVTSRGLTTILPFKLISGLDGDGDGYADRVDNFPADPTQH